MPRHDEDGQRIDTVVPVHQETHQRLEALKPYNSMSFNELLSVMADEFEQGNTEGKTTE